MRIAELTMKSECGVCDFSISTPCQDKIIMIVRLLMMLLSSAIVGFVGGDDGVAATAASSPVVVVSAVVAADAHCCCFVGGAAAAVYVFTQFIRQWFTFDGICSALHMAHTKCEEGILRWNFIYMDGFMCLMLIRWTDGLQNQKDMCVEAPKWKVCTHTSKTVGEEFYWFQFSLCLLHWHNPTLVPLTIAPWLRSTTIWCCCRLRPPKPQLLASQFTEFAIEWKYL